MHFIYTAKVKGNPNLIPTKVYERVGPVGSVRKIKSENTSKRINEMAKTPNKVQQLIKILTRSFKIHLPFVIVLIQTLNTRCHMNLLSYTISQ